MNENKVRRKYAPSKYADYVDNDGNRNDLFDVITSNDKIDGSTSGRHVDGNGNIPSDYTNDLFDTITTNNRIDVSTPGGYIDGNIQFELPK